ncbi:hypothetical protein TSOC_005620 [Tetrabaena socialis]|uniref:Uncharacterized protein n=1 Tax=Tetrabaena socialis TaxID=47790 RepID=A0A2J8A5U6_9CHLO|nr:hypothetical protein TSOC_005620 [Tetrabaena socialis]|eukprot:PNH07888.1 hypothetical protein TSOC_005620 [Tetrabaena socialis]
MSQLPPEDQGDGKVTARPQQGHKRQGATMPAPVPVRAAQRLTRDPEVPMRDCLPSRCRMRILRQYTTGSDTPTTSIMASSKGKSPRWRKVGPLVKSFWGNSIHLLGAVTDPALLAFTLRRLRGGSNLQTLCHQQTPSDPTATADSYHGFRRENMCSRPYRR